MNPVSVNCIWTNFDYDKEQSVAWQTDCGHGFTGVRNLPGLMKFSFCPYCGKPLVVVTKKMIVHEEPVEECLYDYE